MPFTALHFFVAGVPAAYFQAAAVAMVGQTRNKFEELPGLFWDGLDIFDPEDTAENEQRFGFGASLQSSPLSAFKATNSVGVPPGAVGVEVMGLQDTGTNLLHALLQANFGDQIVFYDSTYRGTYHGVWKHANMDLVAENAPNEFTNLTAKGVVPVVMVRNPLSWLQSIKKAPYELQACVDGDDWLERKCVHKVPGGYLRGKIPPKTFKHLTTIWGRWTKAYEPTLSGLFNTFMVVTYEDLVLRTEETVIGIAQTLNLTLPNKIDVIDEPAKTHGRPVGHDAAIDKIEQREYLALYTPTELKEACRQLTTFPITLALYNYTDCAQLKDSNAVLAAVNAEAAEIESKSARYIFEVTEIE